MPSTAIQVANPSEDTEQEDRPAWKSLEEQMLSNSSINVISPLGSTNTDEGSTRATLDKDYDSQLNSVNQQTQSSEQELSL